MQQSSVGRCLLTAFLLDPSNANSSSAVSTFADNFQEDPSRNPKSSLAGDRQGLQSETSELATGHQLLFHFGSGSICMHWGGEGSPL